MRTLTNGVSLSNLVQSLENPLLHKAYLDVDSEPKHIRKTSIICTLGPKTQSVEAIAALRKQGMNIVRMNFSHGTHEFHGGIIKNVRDSFAVLPGRPVAIALDTKGPEIRTGLIKDMGEIQFERGHRMIFTTDDSRQNNGDRETLYIDYKNLPKVMAPGKLIYIDDGTLIWKVIEVHDRHVIVEAQNNGKLSSRKGVNLPSTNVDLPFISDKDKADLIFAVEQGVDMIFASFTRCGADVEQMRALIGEKGKKIKIIAKIENHQGIANFDEILKQADGIMVARGDLGTEIPPQKVFIAQKMMMAKCNIVGKPVICATQMLHTMTTCPRPTRAEVSDIANAVLDGADCVMLSGETASGMFPLESVEMMDKICKEAENVFSSPTYFNEIRALQARPIETPETVASSAVNAALEENAGAIVVLTISGDTARLVSKYRPKCPIICITRNAQTSRQIHLYRGCYPLLYAKSEPVPHFKPTPTSPLDAKQSDNLYQEWQSDVDARIQWAIEYGKSMGLLNSGETVIAIQGWRGGTGSSNTMRVVRAD